MSVSEKHGPEFDKNKLGTLEYNVDLHENAHIVVDYKKCTNCPHQNCVWGCPVQCYTLVELAQNIVFQYEDCVECGTCFLMCDQDSVKWSNPRGTFGVNYKYG
ncbi:MAG: ferredoxin family protein [Candidatus Hodarchaeales archaeon]